jgi:hypothetical protein
MHFIFMAVLTLVGRPQPVPEYGDFDYVKVDAQRDRVYAAHPSSQKLLVVDARTGRVLRQVDVGPMHGLAVDERDGDVFTGDGTDQTVKRVDPATGAVLNRLAVPGPIDDLTYDPYYHRVYADEDSANQIYVIDTRTFELIKTIVTPGHDHETIAVDPVTHDIYQNIPDPWNEWVVIDPKTFKIIRVVHTPELQDNHPLMIDAKDRLVIVGGKNGVMSVYTMAGKKLSQTAMPQGVDQCNFDDVHDLVGCAGHSDHVGVVWVLALRPNHTLKLVAQRNIGRGTHTVAWDVDTETLWTVWGDPSTGSRVAALRFTP